MELEHNANYFTICRDKHKGVPFLDTSVGLDTKWASE